MKWLFFITAVMAVFCSIASPGAFETESIPPLVSSIRINAKLDFCGEAVPLGNQDVRERLEKELILTIWDRPQVIFWLKRSTRYFPIITEELRKKGMPDDIKYVVLVESSLLPHAGSPKGAIGFWQFLESTGKKYGLAVNEYMDQRRNIFFSTEAALEYLTYLHSMFGSWTLAVASFNMGEDGLMTEILEQEIHDYYQLFLPTETQRYILRIIAVKMIMSNPGKYGFNLSAEDYYGAPQFERVQFECDQDIPLKIIARAAATSFKTIKDLNPEIRGYYVSKGDHTILVPPGQSGRFSERFQELVKEWVKQRDEHMYTVQAGDTLYGISSRFTVPLNALLIWNRMDPRTVIKPGDRLVVYKNTFNPLERETQDKEQKDDSSLKK